MKRGSTHDPRFGRLIDILVDIPAVETNNTPSQGIGSGFLGNSWWVKFRIDVQHPIAWNVVQELACILNHLSLNEQLPTTFKPVSPPPYLNGGPEFLSWVIDCSSEEFSPSDAAEWLVGRLPDPVSDQAAWSQEDGEERPTPGI